VRIEPPNQRLLRPDLPSPESLTQRVSRQRNNVPSIPDHQKLNSLIAQHAGTVAVVVRTLAGETLFDLHGDRSFPAASTIKVPILTYALQQAESGHLDLEQRVEMKAGDRVTGSGILRDLDKGLMLTIRDLLTLMIVVSDNTATNMVIELLGVEDINSYLGRLNLSQTNLYGPLQISAESSGTTQNSTLRNETSAQDMAELLTQLASGSLLSPTWTDMALNILSRQHYTDLLGRHVPRDEQGEFVSRVASKSGALMGVRHDVGIIWTPQPLVMAILSEGGLDRRYHPDNHEVQLLAHLAQELMQQYGGL
jgi:beta-lactamase class A